MHSDRTRPAQLGPEFDAFLFAPIGEETSGLTLSVVSALARMDRDPWQEAAILASLPPEVAARNIATLFQALPDESLSDPDRGALATRLIALLPRLARSESVNIRALTHSWLRQGALIFAMLIVLLTVHFVVGRHDSTAPADVPDAATSLPGRP